MIVLGTTILQGDCLELTKAMPDQSVHCCVTSPPYWGLRDYGHEDQRGLEKTPDEYVEGMVSVFREVRRVLRDDGTLWLNLGDSYAGSGKGLYADGNSYNEGAKQKTNVGSIGVRMNTVEGDAGHTHGVKPPPGFKPKDLVGIPWRVAFALQADGWYLRQDIIWAKPNPMPESVRDRCTKSHEYIFMLSKSPRYHYDSDAVAEPVASSSVYRLSQPNLENQHGSDRVPGKTNGPMKAVLRKDANHAKHGGAGNGFKTHSGNTITKADGTTVTYERRNRRSVWTVTTKPFKGAHFATFPPDLIEPCVLAGCPVGGVVLDPFGGAGTTGLVANRFGRSAILCELNAEYVAMAAARIQNDEAAALGSIFL